MQKFTRSALHLTQRLLAAANEIADKTPEASPPLDSLLPRFRVLNRQIIKGFVAVDPSSEDSRYLFAICRRMNSLLVRSGHPEFLGQTPR